MDVWGEGFKGDEWNVFLGKCFIIKISESLRSEANKKD